MLWPRNNQREPKEPLETTVIFVAINNFHPIDILSKLSLDINTMDAIDQ